MSTMEIFDLISGIGIGILVVVLWAKVTRFKIDKDRDYSFLNSKIDNCQSKFGAECDANSQRYINESLQRKVHRMEVFLQTKYPEFKDMP